MNTILLGNLIKIRWIAIFGQITALLFANYILEINILLFYTLLIVLLSVLLNIISYFIEKKNKSISNINAFLFLLFDTSQLGILLYFTGGIINPFSILILAPVITSASYLPAILTVLLSVFSILIIIFINFFYIPLNFNENFIVPEIYNLGLIAALIITIIFIAIYAYLFASSSRKISNALSVSKLQILNQKKISEVGSLSAAAVHELSTPLNTIFLILNDLLKEKKLKEEKHILKDINLLKSEAERCRKILLRLSKNPLKIKDKFLEKVKITNLIKINFDKFNSNKKLNIINNLEENEPEIIFKDEIMYALGNIIQNAITYANQIVTVDLNYLNNEVSINIIDDGSGYPKDILDKLGEPYVSKNNQGMGLGIFIAKNLIENMGGNIRFYNDNKSQAIVEIKFKKSILFT